MIGIPQGLPISATLANLYLLDFDKAVVKFVVDERQGYYRRYSDDIIVLCKDNQKEEIIEFLAETLENGSKVIISKDKTEKYYYSVKETAKGKMVVSDLNKGEKFYNDRPLTYLGFEFYGYKTLIKSANLSKFYRRMIMAVKGKAKHAMLHARRCQGQHRYFTSADYIVFTPILT